MGKEEVEAGVARNSSFTMTAIVYRGTDFLSMFWLNLPIRAEIDASDIYVFSGVKVGLAKCS